MAIIEFQGQVLRHIVAREDESLTWIEAHANEELAIGELVISNEVWVIIA